MKSTKREAIEHYNRMITWAKTQNKKDVVDFLVMEKELGEYWYGSCCPYCVDVSYNCYRCNLYKLNTTCCNNLWGKMRDSKTWKGWIKYAKLVRQYIIDNG